MAMDTARVPVSAAARIWQAPVFLLGLLALAAVTVGRPYLLQFSPNSPTHQLSVARQQLNHQPPVVDQVVATTLRLVERSDLTGLEHGEAHFLLGSALLIRAESAAPSDVAAVKSQARQHLEQADRFGVPDGDRSTLGIRLAKAWLANGTDAKQIIPTLTKIVDNAEDPFEAYGLLAEAYSRLQPPDTVNMMEALRQQVARAPSTTDPAKLARTRVHLAELFLEAQNTREARIVLMRLGNEAPPEILFSARRLLAKCHEEVQDWAAAAKAWEQTRNDPRLPAADKGRVLYALGRAYFANQQPHEAAAAWQNAVAVGGPEGQAAAIRMAELQLAANPKAALAALNDAFKNISKPDEYQNTVATISEVQTLFERAGQQLLTVGDFANAIELTKVYAKVAPPGRALAFQAQASAAWADDLHAKNQGDLALVHRVEAARHFTTAASQLPPGPDSAHWLWTAADLAIKCRDYRQALEALKPIVEMEAIVGSDRVSEAWFTTGLVYEQLKNPAEAKAAFQRCLKAGGGMRYKARFALANMELSEARQDEKLLRTSNIAENEKLPIELRAKVRFDDAEKLLQENLAELRQSVQSDASIQEMTVFGLADLAYERGDYATAEPRLKGALQEYPDSKLLTRAKYRLGLCIWKRAVDEYKSLSNEKLSEPERQRAQKQYLDSLTMAIDYFGHVDSALTAKSAAERGPDDVEMSVRSAFSVAELLALAGRYPDALTRYEALTKRFEGQIEGLHAIHQVWHCQFYYLNDKTRAVEQLPRLRDAIDKMPDTLFDGTSPMHNRAYWADKIVDMSKQMAS